MDNIQDKIAEIMADPEALSQVQSLGKMLGISGNAEPSLPAPPPEPTVENDLFSGETIGKLTALMPLLSQVNQEDDTTRLLAALRPFLGEQKQKKLESARRMLSLMRLLPVLKDGGLLDFFI